MFAAILNSDRRPIDLDRLGLTADDVRIVGGARQVALLRSREPSPVRDEETCGIRSLDDRLWIVGRMRLDGRRDLASALGLAPADDAGLCLHAYAKWGDSFLDHLAGDYCFVLWDEVRGQLIAARDQLGVRSLFHADSGATRVVGDSLEWVAAWKALSRDLDDYWIVDFLTSGYCQDFERTIYREVRRLPPGHVMRLSGTGANVRRYWRLAIDEPVYYRDQRTYGERFRELTMQAVADRMPAGRVGISMSGGLDSTTLAACAVDVAQDPAKVIARCLHYERLVPDDEAGLAQLAARHLGIELQLAPTDDDLYDPQWRTLSIATAEPWLGIVSARAGNAAHEAMATAASVWFEGEGPDNALRFERDAYFSWLAKRRQWGRLAQALWLYAKAKGLRGWGATMRRYTGQRAPALAEPPPPVWLNPGLVAELRLRDRNLAVENAKAPPHPWHPQSVGSFHDPIWQNIFADCDFDEAQSRYVWRHPFLDLRVLQFMLSLPPVPWARRKLVMREAMRGRLPAPILSREKTPFMTDPMVLAMRGRALPELSSADRLRRWVDVGALTGAAMTERDTSRNLAAHALDYWLTIKGV